MVPVITSVTISANAWRGNKIELTLAATAATAANLWDIDIVGAPEFPAAGLALWREKARASVTERDQALSLHTGGDAHAQVRFS
jgi:hypothetical protein